MYVDQILPRLFALQASSGKVRYCHALLYQLSIFARERSTEFWPIFSAALPNLDEAVVEIFHSQLASAMPKNMMTLDGIRSTAARLDTAFASAAHDAESMHLPQDGIKSRPPNDKIGYSTRHAASVQVASLFVQALLVELEATPAATASIVKCATSTSGGQIDFVHPTLGVLTAAQMPPWLKRPSLRAQCAALVHKQGCGGGGALQALACGHNLDEQCIAMKATRRSKNMENCGREQCAALFPVSRKRLFAGKRKTEVATLRADRRSAKVRNASQSSMCLCCSICSEAVETPLVVGSIETVMATTPAATVAMAATTTTTTTATSAIDGVVQLVDCSHVFHRGCLRRSNWRQCGACTAISDEVVRVSVAAAARVFSAECLQSDDAQVVEGDHDDVAPSEALASDSTTSGDEVDCDEAVADLDQAREKLRQSFTVSKGVNPYKDLTPKDRGMYKNLLPASRVVNVSVASK